MGVLFGRREHLKRFRPYKVRPNTNAIPNCWEWGTLNHECIAGITACVEYLADLGRAQNKMRVPHPSCFSKGGNDDACTSGVNERRAAIEAAYAAIHEHESALLKKLIAGLLKIPGLKIYGITDPARFNERCATLAVRIDSHTPLELATKLGDRGFFTWDGNYYALNLTEHLDVEKSGGFLRLGFVHYNTMDEVDRLLAALHEICRRIAGRSFVREVAPPDRHVERRTALDSQSGTHPDSIDGLRAFPCPEQGGKFRGRQEHDPRPRERMEPGGDPS